MDVGALVLLKGYLSFIDNARSLIDLKVSSRNRTADRNFEKPKENSDFARLPIGFLFTEIDISGTCEDYPLRHIKVHCSQTISLPPADELVGRLASLSPHTSS